MERPSEPIDEYTLAAFLAGTLSDERREEVLAFLADNPDARELLCMAQDALEASRRPETETAPTREATHDARTAPLREPSARRSRVSRRVRPLQAISVVVVLGLLGLGIWMHVVPEPDTLRSNGSTEAPVLEVYRSDSVLQFSWTPIADAYSYRITIWDPTEARVIGRHETRTAHLSQNDPFLVSIRRDLRPGDTYLMRVDAVDAQNRQLQSSELVTFTAP